MADAFGDEDVDWSVFANLLTEKVLSSYFYSSETFEEVQELIGAGKMTLTIKGSNFTYTSDDKSVSVVFTVKEDVITKVVIKAKAADAETDTKFTVSISDLDATTIGEDEIEAFVAEVEANAAPLCDMCKDADAVSTKGDYSVCYDCYYAYDFCSACEKLTERENLMGGLCEDCNRPTAVTACIRCQTTENVESIYQSKTQTTYYFCGDCFDLLISCPFCFTFYEESGKCACDGGFGYRTCTSCREMTRVREVDDYLYCDDCAGDAVVEKVPDEAEESCAMCGATATDDYEGYALCDDCYWSADYCDGCDEFVTVHYFEGEAYCDDCSSGAPTGPCAMCGGTAANVEADYALCYNCYWEYGWCDSCGVYDDVTWDDNGNSYCDNCAGIEAA